MRLVAFWTVLGIGLVLTSFHAFAEARRVDQSTPRAAIHSLLVPSPDWSTDDLVGLFIADNDREKEMVRVGMRCTLCLAKLKRSLSERNIEPQGRLANELMPMSTAEKIRTEDWTETVQGDRAIVTPSDKQSSLRLTRIGGRWFIPVSALLGQSDADHAKTYCGLVSVQAQACEAVLEAVNAGRIRNGSELDDEYLRVLNRFMKEWVERQFP